MKDAGGHGSDKRGGGAVESRFHGSIAHQVARGQYNPGQQHTQALAEQHGIDTSHLVGYVPPSRPGDQSPTHNSSGHAWGSPEALKDFTREHGAPFNKGQLARQARMRKALGKAG